MMYVVEQSQANRDFFRCEEQEEEILQMKHRVRQHLKQDWQKVDALNCMRATTHNHEGLNELLEALATATVNSQLRLAYLDGLLFDVRTLKSTLAFTAVG